MIPVAAIIPVGTFAGAKSRLGETLDAEERQDLVERLLARTVAAALAVDGIADVVVVSPDRDVLRRAGELGARTLRQRSRGLNPGLAEARDDVSAGGAAAILVLPIDLPFITDRAIEALLEPVASNDRPRQVVLVPDRHGQGTNALVLRPPDVIDFAFGPRSLAAHRAAAEAAGVVVTELGGDLAIDLDTADDYVHVESLAGEDAHA